MKKYIVIAVTTALGAMFFLTSFYYNRFLNCLEQLEQAENNTKALLLTKDSLSNNNRTLQLSIEQLNYYNDSISRVLKSTIKELNIKDSKIAQLQYLTTSTSKVDTIKFTDTLFVNNVDIDTTATDNKWYSVNLKIKSPNTLIVHPTFKDEIVTIFSHKKETINPPKKCFFLRWFQKKQIITETLIINNNPYSNIDTTRVIETVKL